tara:strand:- start:289 stop:456 length:168 start_codon:yes stop_codon:yes gene_type:complete
LKSELSANIEVISLIVETSQVEMSSSVVSQSFLIIDSVIAPPAAVELVSPVPPTL